MRDLRIGSTETIVKYYNYIREVCDVTQHHDFRPIGGPKDIVEVDESHLFKRKYHRGRLLSLELQHFWVFGAISRVTKELWIERIPDKSRATLDPIIERVVKPSSYIMSDCHRSYINIHRRLNMKGHASVNHSLRFVEGTVDIHGVLPRLGSAVRSDATVRRCKVHINTIESAWKQLKRKLRTCRSPNMIQGYIGEFLYRRNYFTKLPTTRKRLEKLIGDIQRVYPGPGNTSIKRPNDNCHCSPCEV